MSDFFSPDDETGFADSEEPSEAVTLGLNTAFAPPVPTPTFVNGLLRSFSERRYVGAPSAPVATVASVSEALCRVSDWAFPTSG